MKGKVLVIWFFQLIPAVILLFTSWSKLTAQPDSIMLFSELGMEPTGRYIIGVVELCAALFLLTNRLAALGGLMAIGTMLGAIIAHFSVLGWLISGDHGMHVIMLLSVLISALIVTIARRRSLPFIGIAFQD